MDRTRLDIELYRAEASLFRRLTDRERTDQIRELYDLYLAFQRAKSPEQIQRENRAEHRLNRGRMNPRYRELREASSRASENPGAIHASGGAEANSPAPTDAGAGR